MPTAIICPNRLVNPRLINLLKEKTNGKILKIIGSNKSADLTKYNRIILVYQYALSPIRREFTEFYENNKDALKKANLIIDIPTILLAEDVEGTSKELEEIIDRFAHDDFQREKVIFLNTRCTKEQTQMKYARELNTVYKTVFDKKAVLDNPVIITIFTQSESDMWVSKKVAYLYMIIGVCAFVGSLVFLYFLLYDPIFLRGLGIVFIGPPILIYSAYRSKKIAEWRDE